MTEQPRNTAYATYDNAMPTEFVLASKSQRFLNALLDGIFSSMIVGGLGFITAGAGLGSAGEGGMGDSWLSILVFFTYYIPQEAITGRTLGKLITGTQAVNMDGSSLSLGRTLGRTLCRLIPFEALSFLFGQDRPRGWHDRFSGTQVISLR